MVEDFQQNDRQEPAPLPQPAKRVAARHGFNRHFTRQLIAAALAVAIAACSIAFGLRSRTDRAFSAGFESMAALDADFPLKAEKSGWEIIAGNDGRNALGLRPGESGSLRYSFTCDPGEKTELSLAAANGGGVATKLVLEVDGIANPPYIEIPLPAQPPGGALEAVDIDLTPWLRKSNGFFLRILSRHEPLPAEAAATGKISPVPVLSRIEFSFKSATTPRINAKSALFFGFICFLGWWAILGFMLPAGAIFIVRMTSFRASPLARLGRVALVAAGLVLVAAHPAWTDTKPHDDRWALGNARLLALRRFETNDLFFRSRIRPGFAALALPFETLLANRLAVVSYTPSDFRRRLFYVFDRTDATWGWRIYFEASWWGLAMALLGTLMTGACVIQADRRPGREWRAALAVALAGWFFNRGLNGTTAPITLSVTWAFQIAAMLAYWSGVGTKRKNRKWRALILAGALAGMAMLIKEDAFALVLPIALLQGWEWAAAKDGRARVARQSLAFWLVAALFPLVYYGAILDTGFHEIRDNFNQHLASETMLSGYFARSWNGAAQALWSLAGVGLALAALGIIRQFVGKERRPRAAVMFGIWLLGGMTPLLLPYFYPRFFIYAIPPLAWFAAAFMTEILQKVRRPAG